MDYATARFIRLGALLHDIGHLPFGHTLEDELGHLRHHDGNERLSLVADRLYKQYEICRTLKLEAKTNRPEEGWSLQALVNALYDPFASRLTLTQAPFVVLSHIVCKPPNRKDKAKHAQWELIARKIEECIDLGVCRDIVGNTICADFLDYLFRDWHHLGKPLYHDRRLYEYMEVRTKVPSADTEGGSTKFVINVGPREKVRHDALTDILELLNARYKLAETVLFHRTKLSLTGILDRCLLEIAQLYRTLGFHEDIHKEILEERLLESSNDGLVGILRKLAVGATTEIKGKLQSALKEEREAIETQMGKSPGLYDKTPATAESRGLGRQPREKHVPSGAAGDLQAQVNLIDILIERLRDREVYTLGYKLRMSDFNGPHSPENSDLSRLLSLYRLPKNRRDFLRGIEARCELSPGSCVMYCPHDASMNAKIAEVNLLIEGDVNTFVKYEDAQKQQGLTRGALDAQVNRFYELWGAQVFVERSCWDRLSPEGQRNLRSVTKAFFFQADPTEDLKITRKQIECSVQAVCKEAILQALRGVYGNPPAVEKFKGFTFPSGLSFDVDS